MDRDKEMELDDQHNAHELQRLMVDDAEAGTSGITRLSAKSQLNVLRGAGLGAILRWLLFILRDAAGSVVRFSNDKTDRNVLGKLFKYPPEKLDPSRETAWLDGLRGIAASLVMTYHYNLAWFGVKLEAPYGAMEGYGWEIWRLPFLRVLMCSGHTQVSTFFVLSGFVLSWSTLNHIRHGRLDKFTSSLGSSVFRRWLRLYMPCWIVGFISLFEIRWHFMNMSIKYFDTFWGQFIDYLWACEDFSNPFRLDRGKFGTLFRYNWTFWTIPDEFAGSMLVFTMLLCAGRLTNYTKRTLVIGGVVFYACRWGQWVYFLFSIGVLISDYVREFGGFEKITNNLSRRGRIIWSCVLVVGLLLAGVPERNVNQYERPNYEWLLKITPEVWMEHEGGQRFWWCWAGILILTSLSHLRVRKIFETDVCRYLGRVSFMLYLTHRSVYEVFGIYYQTWLTRQMGSERYSDALRVHFFVIEGKFMNVVGYFLFWAPLLPLAILVANWCEVVADAPSVRFAKWVDDKFLKGFGSSAHHSSSSVLAPSSLSQQHHPSSFPTTSQTTSIPLETPNQQHTMTTTMMMQEEEAKDNGHDHGRGKDDPRSRLPI